MSVYQKEFQKLIDWLDDRYVNRINAVQCFASKADKGLRIGQDIRQYYYNGFVAHSQGTISLHGHTNEMLHGILTVTNTIDQFEEWQDGRNWIDLSIPYPIPTMHLTVEFTNPTVVRLEFFGGDEDGKVVSTTQVVNEDEDDPKTFDFLVSPSGYFGPDTDSGTIDRNRLMFAPFSYAIPPKGLVLPKPTIPQPQPVIIPGPKQFSTTWSGVSLGWSLISSAARYQHSTPHQSADPDLESRPPDGR
jgi:hypothetical protein